MLKEREFILRKAVITFDVILLILAFFLAHYLRQHIHNFYKFDAFPSTRLITDNIKFSDSYLVLLLLIVPLWSGMLYLNGMYRTMRTRPYKEIFWILTKSSFLSVLMGATILFLLRFGPVSRIFFILFILIGLVFLLSEKIILYGLLHAIRARGYNYRNILIVGTGRRASQFIHRLESHPEWGMKILGAIDDEPGRGIERVNGVKIIGSLKDLPEIFHQEAVDEVVFVVPRSRLNHIENAVYDCEIEGVRATVSVDLFDMKIAKSRHTEIDGIPLVMFETTPAKESQLFIKRVLDILISVMGLLFLMPLFFVASLLIKLTSSGSVFFKQLRVGLNGRKFVLYKFRTMYSGAEKKLSDLETLNEMGGPVFKIKKDPRITPVGRIVRKFSIDEFPQLFNVLMGHMSLIGPRPPIPKEVEQYESWQRRRLSMRPGLSCLWQISGRNRINFDDWMKLDLEYLDNWSLWLDFKILMKTIPVVVFGIGAY